MAIPSIIEIVPPLAGSRAELSIPGSKSITNRALVAAAFRQGQSVLEGALWSEDTQVMVECLRTLGYHIEIVPELDEPANRVITITGKPVIPTGGSSARPTELFVGNAGTAARFLCALACLGSGCYRLAGVPRMHQRPQAELFTALRQLGYRVDSENDRLPAVVHGAGPKPGASCTVSVRESSQFASALLLAAGKGGWKVNVAGENIEETPYIHMTRALVEAFEAAKGRGTMRFEVEPDASSASYFLAAQYLLSSARKLNTDIGLRRAAFTDWQVDSRFGAFLPLPEVVSRAKHLGDSILTAMIVAPFSNHLVTFIDLGRLRVQECDRVFAMRSELIRCGALVEEHGDTLVIHPSAERVHGGEVETYDDHRIAMCFAVLGLVVPGIKIKDPGCVRKTFPNFFQKIAAPPPLGLGVTILDGATGQPLQNGDLFAD